MRAPAASFKSELVAYRRELLASQNKHQSWFPAALKVLDRWETHPDVESIWDTIKKKFPPETVPTPIEFINGVLRHWEIAHRLAQVNRKAPEVEREVRKTARRHRQHGGNSAFEEMKVLNQFRKDKERILGRRQNGAAPRNVFAALWRDHFRRHSGQPLDGAVSFLVKVAFDFEIDPPNVRLAQRPTTRQGRTTRGK